MDSNDDYLRQRHPTIGWSWLGSTRELQRDYFGIDVPTTPDALADLMVTNAWAATEEIAEAMREIQWKPWSSDRGVHDRNNLVNELVDASHFIANMLVALGVTDDEWQERYELKQSINRLRQLGAYRARNGHMPCTPSPEQS